MIHEVSVAAIRVWFQRELIERWLDLFLIAAQSSTTYVVNNHFPPETLLLIEFCWWISTQYQLTFNINISVWTLEHKLTRFEVENDVSEEQKLLKFFNGSNFQTAYVAVVVDPAKSRDNKKINNFFDLKCFTAKNVGISFGTAGTASAIDRILWTGPQQRIAQVDFRLFQQPSR